MRQRLQDVRLLLLPRVQQQLRRMRRAGLRQLPQEVLSMWQRRLLPVRQGRFVP